MVKEYEDNIKDRFNAKSLEKLRDDVEFMDASLLEAGGLPGNKIAFAFGATGFNAAQSFGPILADIRAEKIPQVHIAGPAGLLGYSAKIPFTKKHIKIPLALRLHGHGKKPGFPLISGWHWAKDYLQGTGKGGIKDNVMLANAVIDELEKEKKIKAGETEVEILGWSRGGTAALLFARALMEKGYRVNCAAFDPVRGGFDSGIGPQEPEEALNVRSLSNKLDAQLQSHEIKFPEEMHDSKITLFNSTATSLAYFANNRVKDRKVTKTNAEGVEETKFVIENKFLATTHDGAAYPFRRFGSKLFSRYARTEVNKLFGFKEDCNVRLKDLKRRRRENNGLNQADIKSIEHEQSDQKAVDAKQLSLLLRQADKILSLARDMRKNPNSVPMRLKMEAQIGRLPNYAASCQDLLARYKTDAEMKTLLQSKALGKFERARLNNVLIEKSKSQEEYVKNGSPIQLLKRLQSHAVILDAHVKGRVISRVVTDVNGKKEIEKEAVTAKYAGKQSMLSVPFILATLTKSTPQLMVDTIGGKAVHLAVVDLPKAAVKTVFKPLFAVRDKVAGQAKAAAAEAERSKDMHVDEALALK